MLNWRTIQKQNFTRWEKLADFLEIKDRNSILHTPTFPLNIPRRLAEKIPKNTLHDPLLRQFLPLQDEQNEYPGFSEDPVSDASFQKTPRLLKKYAGRALLICTSACVMNCRFCFRQNYPYEQTIPSFHEEIKMLKEDSSIFEVILSGGDPLSLSDDKLRELIHSLEKIPHLKLLRFHTRFPIGIPERITEEFLKILKDSRLQTIFVLHTNHPRELDDDVLYSLKKIPGTLLSQTVLLKGVNDNLSILKSLFLKLSMHGIIPYYLHQLDRVKQAAHFEVPIEKGKKLIQELRECLPGYAVPQYVQEIANEGYKTPLVDAEKLE